MAGRLGNVLFWASIGLAAYLLYDVFGKGEAPADVGYVYGFAAVIVLIGLALRYILAGRKS